MSHFGTYLGGQVRTPGVERAAPPARPQDRPRYGQVHRMCLSALETPATPSELARRLGWDVDRAKSWVHCLKRAGLVQVAGWTRERGKGRGGNKVGRYQRVQP